MGNARVTKSFVTLDADSAGDSALGTAVARATANLPQGGAAAIFTITGGKVLITSIVGEVTTVIQTQNNAVKLISNPSVGADVDLCATAETTADAVGTIWSITGTLGSALVPTTSGAVIAQAASILVATGDIDLSCAASNSGQVKWVLRYIPVDIGARVAAA